MSLTWGLLYKLKPGTEAAVEELFRNSGRPEHIVRGPDGSEKGRLLRTLVLVGEGVAVRIIEVEGDLRDVAAHMSRQEVVKDFERQIEQHLAVPRDMVTPEGAQKFFREAGLRSVLDRHHDR